MIINILMFLVYGKLFQLETPLFQNETIAMLNYEL